MAAVIFLAFVVHFGYDNIIVREYGYERTVSLDS